ncbi:MAG: glucodextranase DOMON-like domain-containing protein, partial [Candidatus Hodarchaeales archaeon]
EDNVDFINGIYAAVDENLEYVHFRIDLMQPFTVSSLTGNSSVSIGLYFFDPTASNSVIFPRYADTSNQSEILGFELATELRIEFSDLNKIVIYRVNSSKEWDKQVESLTSIAADQIIEFSVPLSTLNTKKGESILLSVVGTINGKNVDKAPQDGPWRLTIPFGGVQMTEIFSMNDPEGDERGIYPSNPQMHPDGNLSRQGFMDILRFRVGYDDEWTIFEFKFLELENVWNSPVGYSHPLMQVYIDKDRVPGSGATRCDQNGHFEIDPANAWEVLVRSDGFTRYVLWPNDTQTLGIKSFSDAVDKIIVFKAPRSVVGTPTEDWAYTVVVGSQDFSAFREFYSQPQEWKFGGGDDSAYDPNVVDMLVPEGRDQDEILDSYSVAEMRYAVLPAVGPGIGFEEDVTNPIVIITSPPDNSTFTLEKGESEYNLTVTWNAYDPDQGDLSGISTIEVYLDGVLITGISVNDTSVSVLLSAGSHTIRINVFDNSGNYGSATITVTISPTSQKSPWPITSMLLALVVATLIPILKRKR